MATHTRTTLLAYLADEFALLLTETGIPAEDTQVGVKSALDRTFRSLGLDETSGIADADPAEAFADYFLLLKMSRQLANRVSISKSAAGNSMSKDRSRVYTQVKEQYDEAKQRLKDLGLFASSGFAVYDYSLELYQRE